jgi:DNA-binding MarR family transcriptional regulator
MASNEETQNDQLEAVLGEMVTVVVALMKGGSAPMAELAERYDLNFTQLKSLFALSNSPGAMPVSGVAELTNTSLPAAGRAVDGLVKHGLVARNEDPDDRRVKLVELTELGSDAMGKVHERRVETLRNLLEQLSPTDLKRLGAGIAPLRDAIAASGKDNPTCSKERP